MSEKQIHRLVVGLVAIVIVTTLGVGTVEAAPISYTLTDHPDGNLTASHGPYGLRFDARPPAGVGPTYSVSSNGASLILTIFDDNTALIAGQVWNNTANALFNVTYTMSDPVLHGGGWSWNAGAGMLADGPTVLTGKRGGPFDSAFDFLPDDHRLGGYGFPASTWVGRGWLKGHGTNDFVVVATPVVTTTTNIVAEPASLALFGLGLLGVAARRRRR